MIGIIAFHSYFFPSFALAIIYFVLTNAIIRINILHKQLKIHSYHYCMRRDTLLSDENQPLILQTQVKDLPNRSLIMPSRGDLTCQWPKQTRRSTAQQNTEARVYVSHSNLPTAQPKNTARHSLVNSRILHKLHAISYFLFFLAAINMQWSSTGREWWSLAALLRAAELGHSWLVQSFSAGLRVPMIERSNNRYHCPIHFFTV